MWILSLQIPVSPDRPLPCAETRLRIIHGDHSSGGSADRCLSSIDDRMSGSESDASEEKDSYSVFDNIDSDSDNMSMTSL